ncbi:hypothetical protein [Comamonas flocculans]|uniref:DUF2570 domain-containing protein n=1 Tax=Comamonas flocculans TaxID=2597701 RepID=A0A5B8RXG4_9BURK|nr:hypothetical protein [Comamonas flocculans]QEA14261.1 hypothetical protein FOZ74_15160 [Comamonas flocculans]
MSRAAIALAALVLALAAGAAGYARGHADGKAAEAARQDAATVKAMGEQLQAHADLLKRSNVASQAMRAAATRLESANQQTTREMSDALFATAPSRTDCMFPDGVMRGLGAARDRAAQAAASGIRGALPAAATAAQEHAGRPDRP